MSYRHNFLVYISTFNECLRQWEEPNYNKAFPDAFFRRPISFRSCITMSRHAGDCSLMADDAPDRFRLGKSAISVKYINIWL